MAFNAKLDEMAVNTIRFLAADGVEKAKSGHPGLPMGAADYAYVLWAKYLKHDPKSPEWMNRDRFVLSGGHGSMLLYSLLHLAGYGLSLDDLKQFRQWESKTPGHPERDLKIGVETTTGPLGQGISNAVGMSMASKRLGAMFNKPGYDVIDHLIYVILGDGDMMEGISHESCALAGHLALDNIIAFYDDNQISIEGSTELAYTDDVQKRFESYHWHVQKVDGHNREEIAKAIDAAKGVKDKPSLIICKTTIAKGAPTKQGTAAAHGEPLGADEIKAAKEAVGFPADQTFYVPDEVRTIWSERAAELAGVHAEWETMFKKYCAEFPELASLWNKMMGKEAPSNIDDLLLDKLDCSKATATRASSGLAIQEIAKLVPSLWGGSADLAPSNKSDLKNGGDFSKDEPLGFNIHFGVREHGMGSALNGMALYGGIIPYGATFYVFSDYMRPTVRLASIMKQQVVYVFTHDSIFVGEDGPTHEPIEHTASFRAMPGVTVIRPADTAETAVAWAVALERKDSPTCLLLSRQNLCSLNEDKSAAKQLRKGAYVVKDADKVDVIIIATGSEVSVALGAAEILAEKGIGARVVSMPSFELFEEQTQEYQDSVLLPNITKRVFVEAGATYGWEKYIGRCGVKVGLDRFGESAPYEKLAEVFGFTAGSVAEKAEKLVKG